MTPRDSHVKFLLASITFDMEFTVEVNNTNWLHKKVEKGNSEDEALRTRQITHVTFVQLESIRVLRGKYNRDLATYRLVGPFTKIDFGLRQR